MNRRDFPLCLAGAAAAAAVASSAQSNRPSLRLSNASASVTFDLLGGGLVDCRIPAVQSINPFTWESQGGAMEPRPRGHFLCMDRWGQPSEAEKNHGMPFHGEASRVEWKQTGNGRMEASLPMAGLSIDRTASLEGAVLTVRERVTNRNKLGRMYNMVQHPSIAPPFLDEETFVDANCGPGFSQAEPNLMLNDGMNNFRMLRQDPNPNVASFAVHSELGWVTAVSPKHKLMLGYLWDSKQYPWLNLWRHVEGGKPAARGLEFGTTGLHQPFPELARRARMLDKPLYAYIDAGETQERGYRLFVRTAPANAKRVTSVRITATGEIDVQFTS
jgi:hypothetical protein